jgi:hypothetical protein
VRLTLLVPLAIVPAVLAPVPTLVAPVSTDVAGMPHRLLLAISAGLLLATGLWILEASRMVDLLNRLRELRTRGTR